MVRHWIVVGKQVVRVPVATTGKLLWNTQVLLRTREVYSLTPTAEPHVQVEILVDRNELKKCLEEESGWDMK
jgi:hypothetical protein